LYLTSQPPGATVIVDGRSVGATPLEYPLPSGEPVIATFVLAGFEKRREPLSASSGPEVHVELKRRAALTRRPSRTAGSREPLERPLELKTGR
jgi:hypothetical protein